MSFLNRAFLSSAQEVSLGDDSRLSTPSGGGKRADALVLFFKSARVTISPYSALCVSSETNAERGGVFGVLVFLAVGRLASVFSRKLDINFPKVQSQLGSELSPPSQTKKLR